MKYGRRKVDRNLLRLHNGLNYSLDVVMKNLYQSASGRLQHGTKEDIYASPYKYFTLSNQLEEKEGEVANLYVFQKVFKGDFQVIQAKSYTDKITHLSLV